MKTDHKDARGIAELMRLGWFQPVHCKSIEAKETRAAMTARKLVQKQLLETESSVRGILRGFGLKVGKTTRAALVGSEDVSLVLNPVDDEHLVLASFEDFVLRDSHDPSNTAARPADQVVDLEPTIGEIVRLEIVRGLTPSILQRLPASRRG